MNTSRGAVQRGSAMVEVLVSMLLFSLSVLALVRALGISVRDAGEIEYRAVAATIADATIGRMWVDRENLDDYVVDAADVPELPRGTQTVTVDDNVVQVTVRWQPPGAASSRSHSVSATLTGG
jgi:type IV pilus assembly protein PilV